MYLLDTNIWLERLLEQKKHKEVKYLLDRINSSDIYITDFSFHSIGLILTDLKRFELFLKFVNDLFIEGDCKLINLTPEDMPTLIEVMKKFNLDFDDAYQYTVAEKYNLKIISFDKDFDRTERGRMTPEEVLKERKK